MPYTARPTITHVEDKILCFHAWALEPFWMVWSKEKSLAPSRNRTLAFQSVVRRCTDWVISAPSKREIMGNMKETYQVNKEEIV
jgi:hypothetical protein